MRTAAAVTERDMMTDKIAITVTGPDGVDAPMDPQFGRAPFLLLVDGRTHQALETLSNDVSKVVHGAGTHTASVVAQNGVTDVISGQYGPKALAALEQLNVRMWVSPSGLSAGEALAEFIKGNLSQHTLTVFT